jgi:flagellar protein FliS
MKAALSAYKEISVLTVDSLSLVVMLYEEGMRYLKEALEAYEKKEYEKKAERLIYGMEVISELLASLDLERGGEIAKNLRDIYTFMLRELLLFDAEEKPERIKSVIEMLQQLKEAFEEVKERGS